MSKNTRRDILRTTAGAGSVAIVSCFGPRARAAEGELIGSAFIRSADLILFYCSGIRFH